MSVLIIPLEPLPGRSTVGPTLNRPVPMSCYLIPGPVQRGTLYEVWMAWYPQRGTPMNLRQARERLREHVVRTTYQAVHHRVYPAQTPEDCKHNVTFERHLDQSLTGPCLWPPTTGWTQRVETWSGWLVGTLPGFHPFQAGSGGVDYTYMECFELFLLVELYDAGELL